MSETEDSDDGVCPIPIAVPKAAFVAKTDRRGGRAPVGRDGIRRSAGRGLAVEVVGFCAEKNPPQ